MDGLNKYKGVIPAFYACYENSGEISAQRVRVLTEYFVEKKVKGVYVNGSSGECIYQSINERKTVLENVMHVAKGKLTVIAHVACNNTQDSRDLAAHAESLGVDAIAAIPPIYFHLPDYAIENYWNNISGAAPNTDFIIYNIPQLAGVALTKDLYAKMRKNPRVIGVKNSSISPQDILIFKQIGGENSIVFNGPDEQYVSGRAMGAEGGIGGTYGIMPELFLEMEECIVSDNLQKAQKIQFAVSDIIYTMCTAKGNIYAVIKEILRINNNLDIGDVRLPLCSLCEQDMLIAKKAAKMICDAKENFL